MAQTDIHTDMVILKPTRPRGAELVKKKILIHSHSQKYALQTPTLNSLLHCPHNILTLCELHLDRGDENMSEKAIFMRLKLCNICN